ncbi:hypothetical protein [uncultured Eubacterium sp.]|uniref:hypothetical protein n=1 Tax=uncultured Eubacterium sp. TaxID=165185 RepID=UPI0025FAD0AC|nr:hypothetical protein [uncultured Eubacterium sp.]
MTKIFKKTLAFFIAVIMMISSFPYMALAEQSASVNEDGTTAEMTNQELESYIDSKIDTASLTLPEQQLVATADKEYMSGIYTTAGFSKFPVLTELKLNDSTNERFGTGELQYAVAVYTGQNDDIRFPVVFAKYFLNKYDSTSCYIRYVSIPQDVKNFEFVKDWERCTSISNLTYDKDPQCFSSKYDGDHLTNNSFAMNQNKFWRNYIKYAGSGDEENYYEALPTSLDIGFQYSTTKVTGSVNLEHTAYVLNLKPYRVILENLKKEYTEIKGKSSLYTEESVNNYYKAVRDILDFDIKTLLSNMTLSSKLFRTEIADIATKVKTVVENYNSAKNLKLKSKIDFTAYNAAKEKCDTIISNQSKNDEYESNSYAEFEKIYNDVIAKAETVETQEALDDLTAQLITAQTMLRKKNFTITVNIYKNDSSTPVTSKHYEAEYGARFFIHSDIDETKECVKRWVIHTDDNKTHTTVGTIDSIFTLYVTMDAIVDAYVVPLEDNVVSADYSKVVFYGFNGRVIDVKYLKKGDTLTSDKYTKAPDVPFYNFDSWDNASVTGNGEEIAVKAKYTAKQVENDYCTVYYDGFADGKKTYSYDSLVSLVGAKDDEYFALATTANGGDSILTYLNRNEFYAPKTKEIYVVPVEKDARVAKVAITGSYATKVNDAGEIASETEYTKNRAVFNCKFYLPDDCKLVEWGAQISANGKTRAVKGEKVSKHNEYSIYMNVSKTSSVKAFTAVAYVTYRDSNNNIKTIYSQSVTQAFN